MSLNVKEAEAKFGEILEHLKVELKKLRTGRANTSMLDNVSVEIYGQEMKLAHTATITVLDAQMLQIAPFDPNNLDTISAAIRDDQSLGLNPADDGKVIRVPIPPMTQERRQEVVKQIGVKQEEAKVAMRKVRHDVLNTLRDQVKDKELSEEDEKRTHKELDKVVDEFNKNLEQIVKDKEAEVLTV